VTSTTVLPANIQTSPQTTAVLNTLLIGAQLRSVQCRSPREPPTQPPWHNEASTTTRDKSKIRTRFRTTLSPTQTTGAIEHGHHIHSYARFRSSHSPTLIHPIGLDPCTRSIYGAMHQCHLAKTYTILFPAFIPVGLIAVPFHSLHLVSRMPCCRIVYPLLYMWFLYGILDVFSCNTTV